MKKQHNLLDYVRKVTNIQYFTYVIFVLIAAALFFTLYGNVQPETLNIRINDTAQHDILSPITIEDEQATLAKQQAELAKVEDQYTLKTEYAQTRVALLDNLFQKIIDVSQMKKEVGEYTLDEKLALLEASINEEIREQLSMNVFVPLLRAAPDQLDTARNTAITVVRQVMRERIRVGEEQERKQQVAEEINDVNLSSDIRESMIALAQYAIIPNYVYDVQATEEKRQQVLEELTPVVIRTGQVLAKEGQKIDRETYRVIELVGLLNEEKDPFLSLGLALFVILLTTFIYVFLKESAQNKNDNTNKLIFVIIFLLMIVIMKVISLLEPLYPGIVYITPVAMATMLIKMLVNDRIAVITSIALGFCGSILFNNDIINTFNYTIGCYFFFSGLAGAFLVNKKNHRSKILTIGLLVSAVNIFVLLTLVLLTNSQLPLLTLGLYTFFAFLSGFSSSVLMLGLLPFFEAGFGIVSTIKLIELSNPNHPLLRKILTEAPGTYHHSIMVANLSEAACEAIGADGLLARVGSYYHDIGKTKRPHFFIENQMNMENPHNKIAPQLSKTIITSHPYDGAEMLRKYKLPQEIIDIAEQHHGTTLLKYFYYKAKESDPNVLEESFRYPGPKPQTKEIAIISIADSVEAAVRSMKNPNPVKIEALVRDIISDRIQDGQFDECDITMKELDLAAKSMCETLKGIFHNRIEYPEGDKKVNNA